MNYFHELFPKEAERETIVYHVPKGSSLPEGQYAFIEMYCCHPKCDCKEVVIQIEPQHSIAPLIFERSTVPTVVLRFSWSQPCDKYNPTVEPDSPKSPWESAALKVFRQYARTHSAYVARIIYHYKMMKETGLSELEARGIEATAVSSPIKNEPKVGRNELCPCGSGNKFKKCCLKN